MNGGGTSAPSGKRTVAPGSLRSSRSCTRCERGYTTNVGGPSGQRSGQGMVRDATRVLKPGTVLEAREEPAPGRLIVRLVHPLLKPPH